MKTSMKLFLFSLTLVSGLSSAQETAPTYYSPDDAATVHSSSVGSPIEVWCQDRLYILRRAKMKAAEQSYRGNYSEAVKILISGLSSASTAGYQYNPPLTQKIISRGVTIGTEIRKRVGTQVNGLKGAAVLLEAYYDLTEDVAMRIDIPYYTPGNCGYCRYQQSQQLEIALIETARKQINLVNTHLLINGTSIPLGPPDLYLKTAEMISYFASSDLQNSLYANYYACQIRDLNYIHRDLLNFNRQTQSEYAKKQTIHYTYMELNKVDSSLRYTNRCY